ncbi:uncharacterized, partial [Tachysurus ichikawai]
YKSAPEEVCNEISRAAAQSTMTSVPQPQRKAHSVINSFLNDLSVLLLHRLPETRPEVTAL